MMRSIFLGMSMLVVALTCGCGSEEERIFADAKSKTAKPNKSLPKEHKQLIGGWRVVSAQADGKELPLPKQGESRWVITEDTISIDRETLKYSVDVEVTPFQIDFMKEKRADTTAGIFAFEGEQLHFTLGSDAGERPESMQTSPDDTSRLYVLERLPVVSESWPNVELEPSLKADISVAIKLLENDSIEEFLEKLTPPIQYRRMEDEKRARVAANIRAERTEFLNTFRAMLKIMPEMNESGTEATFNLNDVYIQEGTDKPAARMVKLEGHWRVRD